MVVLKDKTGVLGPGLGLEDMSLVVLGGGDNNMPVLLRLVPTFHYLLNSLNSSEQQLSDYLKFINGCKFRREDYRLSKLRDKFNGIAKLMSRILCSPAISAPVERVFSYSGLIMTPTNANVRFSFGDASHDELQQFVDGIRLFPRTGLSECARRFNNFRDNALADIADVQ